jgi:hypothetical protein
MFYPNGNKNSKAPRQLVEKVSSQTAEKGADARKRQFG